QPMVFSLKSRRSLFSRPPEGGEYGAILMTASRGRSLFSLLVATDANLDGSGVCFESLSPCECCHCWCEFRKCSGADLLGRDDLHVIGGGESTPQTRGS